MSLTEALVSAQDYVDLAGEMPTQNAAVLRLLLAVLFTVFSRVDAKGEPRPLMQSDDALERWSALWQLGHFPAAPVRDYLDELKTIAAAVNYLSEHSISTLDELDASLS